MSHTITRSPDGKYLELKTTGDITRDLAIAYNLELHKMGQALGLNRFLLDVTESRNVDTTTHNYDFAQQTRQTPDIDRTARLALLVSPDDHSHDFVETVALGTGST